MKKRFFLLFLLALVSFPVAAAEKNKKIDFDPAVCQMLVKHTPDADVAYQPGVDVNGNAVAPADLPDQPKMELPSVIKIPVTVSLANTIHLDTTKNPWKKLGSGTEATLGTITLEGDKAYFNGEPLSDEQQDNLAVLCMKPKGAE